MNDALRVVALSKSYARHAAVSDLSFSVRAGELACLIGPNGAGKSTTMRILGGLQLADSGHFSVAGERVESPARAKQLCGLTPQDVAMFDHLTGAETLALVGAIRAVPDAERAADEWLRTFELDAARHRLVRQYSGGMKRKLAVACAMLHRPPLVLLDESFVGLDPESTQALQQALRRYCDEGGAVVLSSHILDMVQTIADRVIVMRAGQCVAEFDRAALDRRRAEGETVTSLYFALTRPDAHTA
mgnify:CR=1 FL=1